MASASHYKKSLLKTIDREWTALMNVVERLSPQQMTSPDSGGWSPKDNLAHLSAWMKVLTGYHMDGRPSHEVLDLSPEDVKDWDFNIINRLLFERNQNRPTEDVLAELKNVYALTLARLEATPFEELMKPRRADDPAQRPLVLWVMGDTSEHFAEHRATLEKLLK